jgi:hypothetical protein
LILNDQRRKNSGQGFQGLIIPQKFPMKTKPIIGLTLGLLLVFAGVTQAQNFSPEELHRRTVERRAVEAVIWGMPAVNAELMFKAVADAGAGFN